MDNFTDSAPDGIFSGAESSLLGPVQIRELADRLGIRPTKTLGQNFVHDAGTVRRIVRDAEVQPGDPVLEVGPGLGSLTLALLDVGAVVSAVEIDEPLAAALPNTVSRFMPQAAPRFAVVHQDALEVSGPADLAVPESVAAQATSGSAVFEPKHLVANLPYNVAVPVLLRLLDKLPSLHTVTVMVQLEVADRLAAAPGSKVYGVPSVKAAWYADVRRGAKISRNVFWPVPNVDSALVHMVKRNSEGAIATEETATSTAASTERPPREDVFAVVDAAFAQRRKTLRAALGNWAGTPARAEEILRAAGVDPKERGENLTVSDFARIAAAAK